jgi:hypothetical protein
MSEERTSEFERRTRAAFNASVDDVDMRIRSRLTRARHAALEAASTGRLAVGSRTMFSRSRWVFWAPAFGAAAALLLGVALWVGHSSSDVPGLEDLELVASNDQMDLLQDDPEFYDWVDKAPAAETAGSG